MPRNALPDYPMPDGFSASSQRLWQVLVPRRARSIGRRALLEETLRARDRAEEFRLLIAAQGLVGTTKTTGMVHMNPLVRAEKDARALFAKLASLLGLQWDSMVDGRVADDDDAG